MRRMTYAVLASAAVLFTCLLATSSAMAQAPAAPVNLAFATLDTGSAWYVYGATMAELLRKTLPPGSNIDVKPRSGGVGNPRLVAKNETPLGLAFTVTNRWAHEGKEAYTEKLENIRGLVGGLGTGPSAPRPCGGGRLLTDQPAVAVLLVGARPVTHGDVDRTRVQP